MWQYHIEKRLVFVKKLFEAAMTNLSLDFMFQGDGYFVIMLFGNVRADIFNKRTKTTESCFRGTFRFVHLELTEVDIGRNIYNSLSNEYFA